MSERDRPIRDALNNVSEQLTNIRRRVAKSTNDKLDSLYGNIHNYYPTNRWPPQNKKEYLEKQTKKGLEKIWVGR